MILRMFILLVCLLVSPALLAGTFFGNSGDGVDDGVHLYVRDLFESGTATQPYFGTISDPRFERQFNLAHFQELRPLMARKLSDLNRAYDGLGDLLLQAIAMYHWEFTDLPLELIPDIEQVKLPESVRRVQLANRLGGSILISRPSWSRLDLSNRVALILHEASYSLLVPTCTSGECQQLA